MSSVALAQRMDVAETRGAYEPMTGFARVGTGPAPMVPASAAANDDAEPGAPVASCSVARWPRWDDKRWGVQVDAGLAG